MHEYVTVSSSSYDPASLAAKLTEKSGDGWTVVAIVPTGGDVTAFLSREATSDSGGDAAPASASAKPTESSASEPVASSGPREPEPAPPVVAAPEPVAEPAGWAIAPDAAPAATAPASAPVTQVIAATPAAVAPAVVAPVVVAPAVVAPAVAAPAAVAPAVPAGWYADPAGRFELRYWDGGTWTEHVSRAGQQFTDPPVA